MHQPTFGFDPSEPAPGTRELLDAEVRRILDEGGAHARRNLSERRPQLDSLVEALLAAETLDAEEAYRAAGVARPETGLPVDVPVGSGIGADGRAATTAAAPQPDA